MQLFFTPDIGSANIYTLPEQESKHCVRVLRLSEGDKINLTDGVDNMYEGEILDANHKACALQIINKIAEYEKRRYYLHVAIAPTKNIDRYEWFLEKATEIGIDEITPIISEHSERKQIKPDRLERVIVAAMKQSLKAYKPQLNPLIDMGSFLNNQVGSEFKGIAHCNAGDKKLVKEIYKPGQNAVLLIGPEGDFSPEEVKLAINSGFEEISLGASRLRTETAGVVAAHTISLLCD